MVSAAVSTVTLMKALGKPMFGEPFDVPAPDTLVFVSWFQGGEIFRSGAVSGGKIPEAISLGIAGARCLQPGDVIELEVEGIGALRNTLAPKQNIDPDYRYKPKA